MQGIIHSINLSPGGVPKLPVLHAHVHTLGIEGDKQKNPNIHGGPERAVCLFSLQAIEKLRAQGHPIAPGTIGENITVAQIDWGLFVPGALITLGRDVRLEVTRYTKPCKTIRGSFSDGDFRRVLQEVSPGMSRVYAKVLQGGFIQPGDPVTATPPTAPAAS